MTCKFMKYSTLKKKKKKKKAGTAVYSKSQNLSTAELGETWVHTPSDLHYIALQTLSEIFSLYMIRTINKNNPKFQEGKNTNINVYRRQR